MRGLVAILPLIGAIGCYAAPGTDNEAQESSSSLTDEYITGILKDPEATSTSRSKVLANVSAVGDAKSLHNPERQLRGEGPLPTLGGHGREYKDRKIEIHVKDTRGRLTYHMVVPIRVPEVEVNEFVQIQLTPVKSHGP